MRFQLQDMQFLELLFNIDPVYLHDEKFLGLIFSEDKLCGNVVVKSFISNTSSVTNVKSTSTSTLVPLKRKTSPNDSKNKPTSKMSRKHEPASEVKQTRISTLDFGCEQKLSACDMIKTMQDFDTKKKTFCCVVCKYESVHNTTIKRHVEMKHMPQTVTLNC